MREAIAVMTDYTPRPIDTAGIELDASLADLLEMLAENTHDVWARERIQSGWRYGPERNDTSKEHPCLLPYADLPEAEKTYDRNTAFETIRAIVKLGFRILPPDPAGALSGRSAILNDTIAALGSAQNLRDYIEIWERRDSRTWADHPQLFYMTGKGFLRCAEPLLAYDAFNAGLGTIPHPSAVSKEARSLYVALVQQQALALAETGAVKEAARLLEEVTAETGDMDPETYGIAGRAYKEMALRPECDVDDAKRLLSVSFGFYNSAYSRAVEYGRDADAYYNGINAASVAVLSGNNDRGAEIAEAVSIICRRVLAECEGNDEQPSYWLHATLGEVALLTDDRDKAIKHYRRASARASNDVRARISMRRQAARLLRCKGKSETALDEFFRLPTVVVFAGERGREEWHDDDGNGAENEQFVRGEIRKGLQEYSGIIAYSTAISGADIVFIEEVIRAGGEANIVLPFTRRDVKQVFYQDEGRELWAERFDHVCVHSRRVIELTHYHAGSGDTAEDCVRRLVYGLGLSRSNYLDCQLENMSVTGGATDEAEGSAARALDLWGSRGASVRNVHPFNGLQRVEPKYRGPPSGVVERKTMVEEGEVGYFNYLPLLFADVRGYSNLDETQLVAFSTAFLQKVRTIFDRHMRGILQRRTQGDGMFVIFNSLAVAVQFALDLIEMVEGNNWEKYGLPRDLTVRVSLDAGPCFSYTEPITGNLEFGGNYVIRAARMEPITPPGHIYASETFVALSRAEGVVGYQFVYSGQVVLPKGQGVIPAYHVVKE